MGTRIKSFSTVDGLLAQHGVEHPHDPHKPPALLAVHGKNRGLRNLVEDGHGGYKCRPGNECELLCAIHGKSRAKIFFVQNVDGRWVCKEDCACIQPHMKCSIHGKLRNAQALQSNVEGQLVCKPGQECRDLNRGSLSQNISKPALGRFDWFRTFRFSRFSVSDFFRCVCRIRPRAVWACPGSAGP